MPARKSRSTQAASTGPTVPGTSTPATMPEEVPSSRSNDTLSPALNFPRDFPQIVPKSIPSTSDFLNLGSQQQLKLNVWPRSSRVFNNKSKASCMPPPTVRNDMLPSTETLTTASRRTLHPTLPPYLTSQRSRLPTFPSFTAKIMRMLINGLRKSQPSLNSLESTTLIYCNSFPSSFKAMP